QTVLLSTHYMEEAEQLCHRIAIMDHGQILALDTAAGLKQTVAADTEIRIQAEGDLDDLARELTGRVDGAVDARVVEDTVHLSVRGGRRLLPQVLAAADDAGGGERSPGFSTLLVAGVVGLSVIFTGIQAVALPLVNEFGYTKEIEDRILAPLPVWAVAVEKIVAGAIQALIAGAFVFPLAALIPSTPVHHHVHWAVLVTLAPLACLLGGALGLAIGTRFDTRQVPLIFSIIVLPITFLGAMYYTWSSLAKVRWLQLVVLV